MICNKVLIALTALFAVAVSIPWFPIGEEEGAAEFDVEYEANNLVWGNAPLKAKPDLPWGFWNQPADQTYGNYGGSEVESENDVESSEIESENNVGDLAADAAAGGATDSGEAGADPAAGAAIGADAGAGANSGTAANAGAPVLAEDDHVYAAAGPAPGALKAGNSGAKGLGIAVGVCLLVVATTTVAVFAIRHYWRHRL